MALNWEDGCTSLQKMDAEYNTDIIHEEKRATKERKVKILSVNMQ